MPIPPAPQRPSSSRAIPISSYVDEADRVLPGVVCDGCRYDLRGQSSRGRCPECGDAIGPMLREMVLADARRPWYVVAVIGCTVISAACLAFAYVIGLVISNYDPPRLDWYVILQIAMAGTVFCAFVAGAVAGLGELLRIRAMRTCGAASALGFLLATLIYFAFAFLVATQ